MSGTYKMLPNPQPHFLVKNIMLLDLEESITHHLKEVSSANARLKAVKTKAVILYICVHSVL